MARARLLKPGFFSNEALCDLHPFGRLLFAGLWTLADREGRLPDRPKVIKGALFPFENVPVDKLLGELDGAGFIMRYEVEGERYIQVVKFLTHQHVHKNEAESVIPSAFEPRTSDTLVRQAPVIYETAPVISQPAPAEAEAVTDTEASTSTEAETGESPIVPVVRAFERCFGRLLSPMEIELIKALDEEHPRERIDYALRESASLGKRNVRYVKAICESQAENGDDHERKPMGRNGGTAPQVGDATTELARWNGGFSPVYVPDPGANDEGASALAAANDHARLEVGR